MNNDIIPFSLDGEGYSLTIAPEAEARKAELLVTSSAVKTVTDNDESGNAQFVTRSLAAMRIEVEKSRKLVKEPINRIGKLIDTTAKEFLAELGAEEARIGKLVGDHAMQVARAKAEAERIEREAFEAARAAREAADRAAAAAEEAKENKLTIAEIAAARTADKAAETERQRLLAERMAASTAVAETNVASGVRFAWDFEVEDVHLLYNRRPTLVTIEPRRSDILAMLKLLEANGETVELVVKALGIRAFKKPIVASR